MANERLPLIKGKPIEDAVTVVIGSQSFDGWERVSITKNLESIANAFSIDLFDRFEEQKAAWPIRPGLSVKVNIGRERVITGRIEQIAPEYNDERRGYTITGRSNPGDLVDCNHEGPYEYKNISLDKLAEELVRPFGLKVFLSVEPGMIAKFSVKPDETVFEALDRAARLQGFFFVSTREGNVRLTRAARARAFSSIQQGFNILSAGAVYDDSKRHNKYTVKGQTSGLDEFFGENVSQAQGQAFDRAVTRHRPLIMTAEGSADSAVAKTRAEWEASSRLAQSTRVSVTVQGWRQGDGSLWGINQIVHTKSGFLGINRDMLISSVEHSTSSEDGEATTMELIDPNSYNPEPEKNKKKKDDIFSSLGAEFSS